MFDYTQQRLGIYAFNDPKNFPKYEDAYPFLNQLKEEVVQAVSEEEEKKKKRCLLTKKSCDKMQC